MTTKYKILFLVEIQHDYYRNLQCNDFNIVPSEATKLLLKDQQMLYKMAGNKLIVLVKVDGNSKPVATIDASATFRFYLELVNPYFVPVTRLDLGAKPLQKLYFNNLAQNKPDGYAYLTDPHTAHDLLFNYSKTDIVVNGTEVFECTKVPATGKNTNNNEFWQQRNRVTTYSSATSYNEGDVVNDNGIVYIRRRDGAANIPTSDNLFWQLRCFAGLAQYVTEKNCIELTNFIKEFSFGAATTDFDIKVFGLNTVTNQYDRVVLSHKLITEKPVTAIKIDFSEIEPGNHTGLKPGKYIVKINSNPFNVYFDNEAYSRGAFGVIEIFNHLPDGNNFALLNGGKVKEANTPGQPPGLNYTIRFANRFAYWKYVTPKHSILSIDGGADYTFVPTPIIPTTIIKFYTSDKPIALKEAPWKFIMDVERIVTVNRDPHAPNPDPRIAGMMTRKDPEKDYYCTINLNY